MEGLDASSIVPLYKQLKDLILKEIKEGKLKTNQKIPTEQELSEKYQISRMTVRKALAQMRKFLQKNKEKELLFRNLKLSRIWIMPIVLQIYVNEMEKFREERLSNLCWRNLQTGILENCSWNQKNK